MFVMARLKPDEIKKLTEHLTQAVFANKAVEFKVARPKIQDAIHFALTDHFEEERQIEEAAEKLYKEHSSGEETGGDKSKAMHRIRKQLAEKDEFILSGGAGDSRFSEDKLSHLGHLVGDKIYDDDLADFAHEDDGPQFFKKLIVEYFGKENEASDRARKKILSLKDAPFEGSREWDTLYRKYFEEELRRLGHV